MAELTEENLLSTALDNFFLDNFETALEQIDKLLSKFTSTPSKSEYMLYKAICKLKLGNYEGAKKDLDEINNDTNFNKDYRYYLTLGKVLYYLCKFNESKEALNTGIEKQKDKCSLFTTWINKVEEELKE